MATAQSTTKREWQDMPTPTKQIRGADEGWQYLENPHAASEYTQPQPLHPDIPSEPSAKGDLGEAFKQTAKGVIGAAEATAGMASSFFGALPAAAAGLYQAIKDKKVESYPEAFKFVQQYYTYEPKSAEGKAIQEVVGNLFQKYSNLVEKGIVEPNIEHGNVLAAAIGKTSAEALPLLLPAAMGGKAISKGKEVPSPAGEVPPTTGGIPPSKPLSPLEGQPISQDGVLMPRQEQIPAQQGAIEKAPIEGQVVRPELPPPTSALPEAQEVTPGSLPAPPKDSPAPTVNDTTGAVSSLTQARAEKDAVAHFYNDSEIEHITLQGGVEEQLKSNTQFEQQTSAKILNFVPRNQQGALDPTIFKDVWDKTMSTIGRGMQALSESGVSRGIKQVMNPVENMPPLVAAAMKQTANEGRAIEYSRSFFKKGADQFSKDAQDKMGLARENPQVANTLNPEEKAFTDAFWNYHSAVADAAFQKGIIKTNDLNWFPHLVKDYYAKRTAGAGGGFRTTVGSAVRRKWTGTIEEVEAKSGLERIHSIQAAIDVTHDLAHAVRGRNIIDYVRDMVNTDGDMHVGYPGEDVPNGVPLTIPGATERTFFTERSINYQGQKYPIKNGYVNINNVDHMVDMESGKAFIDGKQYTVQSRNMVKTQFIKVHPEIKAAMDVLAGADNPNVFYKGMLGFKVLQVRLKMLNPIFHHITVAPKVMLTLPFGGLSPKVWWHPENLYGPELYNAMSTGQRAALHTPFGMYVAGSVLRNDRATVMEAMRDNLVVPGEYGHHMDVYGVERPPEITKTWMQNTLNNMAPALELGDKMQALNRFWSYDVLWKQIGNAGLGVWKALKTSKTKELVDSFAKKNGRDPTAEEYATLSDAAGKFAGHTATLATSMLGREDFGNAYRRNLDTFLFSRQNTMSNIRMLKMGMGLMPKFLQGQLAGVAESLGKGTAVKLGIGFASLMILKDIFLTQGLGNIVNYATTAHYNIPDKSGKYGGHFMSGNDEGKDDYISLYTDSQGAVVYMNSPFRSARDITRFVTHPIKEIGDKLNPTISWGRGMITGTDWTGKSFLTPGGTPAQHILDYLEWSGKEISGYEKYYGSISPDKNHSYRVLQNFGLQPSRGTIGGPPMSSLMKQKADQTSEKEYYLNTANQLLSQGKQEEGVKVLMDHNLFSELTPYFIKANNPALGNLIHLRLETMLKSARTPEEREQIMKEMNAIQYGTK